MTHAKTIARALEEGLANENRRIVSVWRAGVILRRATLSLPPSDRRWTRAPEAPSEINRVLSRLEKQGALRPLEGLKGMYIVSSPFARRDAPDEFEVLMEAHPFSCVSHFSALVFHGLSEQFPQEIHVTVARSPLLPIGTTEEDWTGSTFVSGQLIDTVMGTPIRWHRLRRGSLLGAAEYSPSGYPVRVTDPEMTLLDGLQNPDWCGGWENVLFAWRLAEDSLDLERIVNHVEECDVAILKQRAGWILEEMGLHHPALDRWAANAKRGGSSRLLASAPFAPRFSERWKLSLNAPVEALKA